MLFVRVTVRDGEVEGGVGVVEGEAVMLLLGVRDGVGVGVGELETCVPFDHVGDGDAVRVALRVSVEVVLGVGDGVRELVGVWVTDGVVD